MKSTLRQQHQYCRDEVIVEQDNDGVKFTARYIEVDTDYIGGLTNCYFDKASFIEFLEYTLAMLKVEG